MSTTDFSAPGPGAGITSQIEMNRAKPMVLHNSKLLCWITMSGAFFAAIMSLCMVLMVFSLFSAAGAVNWVNAAEWGFGACAFGYMCPWFWKLGSAMAGYKVTLDSRGALFNIGTRKKPADLFMPWEGIAAIKSQRAVNVQQFFIQGTDGSQVSFSSYTFFRPKHVARMIAARTGLPIQKI